MIKGKMRVALLILVALILASFATGFVFADEGLYPDLDEAAQNSGDENFIKYRDNYYLDSEKMGMLDGVSAMFAGAANALLSFQKELASMQITVFNLAMKSNVIDLLNAFVTPFIDSMKIYVFDEFSLYFISICALILLLRLVANRQAQALTGLLQTLVIIVLAFFFFNYPVDMMEKTDQLTQNVSDTVLEAPYEATYGDGAGEDMDGKISALVWNVMVHKPWQLVEFGNTATAKEYEGEILKHAPESKSRKVLVKQLAKDEGLFSKSMSYQIGRVTSLFFMGIFNLAIFLCLTFFCGIIVMYRVLIMVYMLLGILVFLLALIPYFGIELVRRWAGRILGACSTKILLTFLLAMILVFMEAVYGLIDSNGLLETMFTIIVIIAAFYTKRKEITSLFSGFRFREARKAAAEVQNYAGKTWRNAGMAWNAGRQMSDRMTGAYNRYHGSRPQAFASRASRPGAAAGNGEVGLAIWRDPGNGFSFKTEKGNFYSPGAGGNYQSGRGGASGVSGRPAAEKSSARGSAGAAEKKETDAMKDAAEAVKKSTKDMSRYYKKAEQLLQRQYDKSKGESEEKARRKGEAPRYGEFVRRTDAIRGLGAGTFDQRDLATTARILQRVEKSGGNVDHVIVGNQKELYTQVKRPENLSSKSMNSGEQGAGAAGPATSPGQEKRGLEYFRSNFGEEKGEEFYSNLSSKYGTEPLNRFSSSEKLTYSQVLRMVREAEGSKAGAADSRRKQHPQGRQPKGQKVKRQPPVKMRKSGE